MYCRLISDAVLSGIQRSIVESGAGIGAGEQTREVITKADLEVATEGKAEADEAQGRKAGRGKGGKSNQSSPSPKKAPTVMVKKTIKK